MCLTSGHSWAKEDESHSLEDLGIPLPITAQPRSSLLQVSARVMIRGQGRLWQLAAGHTSPLGEHQGRAKGQEPGLGEHGHGQAGSASSHLLSNQCDTDLHFLPHKVVTILDPILRMRERLWRHVPSDLGVDEGDRTQTLVTG